MSGKWSLGLADEALRASRRLRAAIYDRVSQDKRKKRKSVGEQDVENRQACEDNEWEIVRSYADNAVSASRFTRKERQDWMELLADLEARMYDVLVVWEVSRADRKLGPWVLLVEICRDLGVLIHVTSQDRTYDARNVGDWSALIQEGVQAATEPEKTSKRISRHTRNAALAGKPHGRILYGYRREYTIDEDGTRVLLGEFPDETPRESVGVDGVKRPYTPAGVVREAAERTARGEAGFAIAQDLNARGIPTPRNARGGWTQSQIREMVINPGYLGKRVFRGQVLESVTDVRPALLDVRTFEACKAIFADPSRRVEKPRLLKYLGSGLFLCGVCGSWVRVQNRRGGRTYACHPVPPPPPGTSKAYCVGRLVDEVDDYVERSIWLRLAREDIMSMLVAEKRADARAAELETKIAELQGRLDEARDAYAAKGGGTEGLMRIEAQLEPEIDRLRAEIRQSRVEPVLRGLILPDVKDVEAEWRCRTLAEQREVIRVLTESVEILRLGWTRNTFQKGVRDYAPEESVRITWRKPGR